MLRIVIPQSSGIVLLATVPFLLFLFHPFSYSNCILSQILAIHSFILSLSFFLFPSLSLNFFLDPNDPVYERGHSSLINYSCACFALDYAGPSSYVRLFRKCFRGIQVSFPVYALDVVCAVDVRQSKAC